VGNPTPGDPLGMKPDPADFGDAMNAMIDARIETALRGRTDTRFNNVPDAALVHELLARGWAVFIPAGNKS
jgi:hypothetical protein